MIFVITADIDMRAAASQNGVMPSKANSMIMNVLPHIKPRTVNKSQLFLVMLFSIQISLSTITFGLISQTIKGSNYSFAAFY